MHVVHLTASTHFGGPERQMLGLARSLAPGHDSTFVSFREGGRCDEFLRVAALEGFDALPLRHDTPQLRSAARELTGLLGDRGADVLLCHGYKANLVGRVAARRAGVPAVAVSRGWTGECLKVRAYEQLDRWHLRFMDHVVAVSDGQADKVRRAGVPAGKLTVIRNSARGDAFADPDPALRYKLLGQFPGDSGVSRVVLAAGRLSPEKGFDVLAEAAARVLAADPAVGFVVFGEGPERAGLERRVAELGIARQFRLPGFTRDLDRLLPWADLLVQSSYTEGLPNVVLEAGAAGVPVVATAVGGTPEVVAGGETGRLVAPGDAAGLADRIVELLADAPTRRRMGAAARARMREHFSFSAQAAAYVRLFESLRPQAVRLVA
jgi:glycosyltransferase involved in cell wall biosynthesis